MAAAPKAGSPPKGVGITDAEQYVRDRAGSMTGVNRICLLAVDASENAKNAFDCEYGHSLRVFNLLNQFWSLIASYTSYI